MPPSAPIAIGNCQVLVEAKNFTSDLNQEGLNVSIGKTAKISISVVEKGNETGDCENQATEKNGDYYFLLANPKNCDDQTKSSLKDALSLYMRELPAMNYAANTGKQSTFLERCVTHGKYCTLVLVSIKEKPHREVIAAVTYQIIPADTQYAEIPLAAVTSILQRKGIGSLLYRELKKRLWRVGIRSIFCWGDKFSERFWVKLGFSVIGAVDTKGRAGRLPIKTGVRKALCFPGGSTLMVAHLLNDSSFDYVELSYCSSTQNYNKDSAKDEPTFPEQGHEPFHEDNRTSDGGWGIEQLQIIKSNIVNDDSSGAGEGIGQDKEDSCSCSIVGSKRRIWAASCTSLMSKKVKATVSNACRMGSQCAVWNSNKRIVNHPDQSFKLMDGIEHFQQPLVTNTGSASQQEKNDKRRTRFPSGRDSSFPEAASKMDVYIIMLMDIADGDKKSYLTKVIEDLGGIVAACGNSCTHIVSGKVRKTLNFCTGLCSGAWVVSSAWLKESFRNGSFVDETHFILKDEEYISKYRSELKDAVLRAKASPNALLKGFDICLSAHVQPPPRTMATIVSSAGGNVIHTLNKALDSSKTIFIACEQDMDEALSAVKMGISTFSSDWLMNCIMIQELDLSAQQFAESL